ncbi:MAG: hypothetical protein BGO51_27475 [Rhodospirillales bacterium 69-11]|nr:MAG: hypothetical protein BGO51_27475 [Rhodospirillales bacterium 69-11]
MLAGGLVYLWQNPQGGQSTAASDSQLASVDQRLQTLETRLSRLEQRPSGSSVDLGPLTQRVDALEKQGAGNVDALAKRVSALEQKSGTDPQIASRLDALSSRLDTLAGREKSNDDDLSRRLDAEAAKVASLESAASKISGLADRASRLARLQAAQAALSAGQPLGELPNAPSALSRWSDTAPPTEGALRLAYPAAERAALAASGPDADGKPFLDRVLARAQDLVTIRQGDHVIVGDQAAGVLARARTALDAGDLPAAVSAVDQLQGPARDAMADWLGKAKALLAARAALADLAAKS